jgi:hypothetical protein
MTETTLPLPRAALAAAGLAAALLTGCAGMERQDAADAPGNIEAAWTEIDGGNQLLARVITRHAPASAQDPVCPNLLIDGSPARMALRAAAGTAAQRPTASDPSESRPSAFPVSVCEAPVPASAQSAVVAGRALALAKAAPRRIAVIGDSGCRMKKSDHAWQACNDADAWPFAKIAAAAAALNPDLVLHVGDYQYRENACPPGAAGCQGSPWGYGWDAWQADLFTPAAPLLAKAPWVMARGNHEECARAGQGWQRFLDTRPYSARLSCDDPAHDAEADHADPYAVALGGGAQFIVFDSSREIKVKGALDAADPRLAVYRQQFDAVAALARQPGIDASFFVSHHPVLAFVPNPRGAPRPGNRMMQSVLAARNGQAYFPAGIALALSGHVHGFQAISFASGHPAAIVAGNSGDALDAPLPDPLPPGATPAPGAVIAQITHHARFGFLMMERPEPGADWTFKSYAANGQLLATCRQSGRKLDCDHAGSRDAR